MSELARQIALHIQVLVHWFDDCETPIIVEIVAVGAMAMQLLLRIP